MEVLSRVIPSDAIISIDVGENGWWFGRNFRMNGQKFIMSGYLATMGFGFQAIAAKIASLTNLYSASQATEVLPWPWVIL